MASTLHARSPMTDTIEYTDEPPPAVSMAFMLAAFGLFWLLVGLIVGALAVWRLLS